jgi:hypothetical protein
MKRLIAASLIVALSCSVTMAEQVVQEVSWQELAEAGKLLAGQSKQAESPEGRHALKVDNQDGQPRTVTVLILDRPKITTVCHAITGEVAYEGMAPGSCLEMWTTFEGGEMVFSRTLAPTGPLQSLTGTSGWRGFVLPLFSVEALGPPRRIELNVVFAAGGTVSLGPLRLMEYSKGESPLPGMAPPPDQPFERPKPVGEVSWKELGKAGKLPGGKLLEGEAPEPIEQLVIEHADQGPKTVPVALIEKPDLKGPLYQVVGWVKHEKVAPGSYLEMWSTFAAGGRYVQQTLAPSGQMRNLDGSYDWRPFALPFLGDEKMGPPTRLEINVVLAGPGRVSLSPLRIEEYPGAKGEAPPTEPTPPAGAGPGPAYDARPPTGSATHPVAAPGAWWDDRTAGLIGGVGGVILGLLGGLMGSLGGFGKARRLVITLAVLGTLGGAVSLALGLVALGLGQPYAVCFPLLLSGAIATAVCGSLLQVFRRRYAEIELRKMTAMDIGASK